MKRGTERIVVVKTINSVFRRNGVYTGNFALERNFGMWITYEWSGSSDAPRKLCSVRKRSDSYKAPSRNGNQPHVV